MHKFSVNKDGYFSHYGSDGTIPMNEEFNLSNLPTKHQYVNGFWILDLNKLKEDKIEEVRQCRSDCWQKFDGLWNSIERDLQEDVTNVELIAKFQACKQLRQSLKDVPATALSHLENATTLEDVQVVCFENCIVIPDELVNEVSEYFK